MLLYTMPKFNTHDSYKVIEIKTVTLNKKHTTFLVPIIDIFQIFDRGCEMRCCGNVIDLQRKQKRPHGPADVSLELYNQNLIFHCYPMGGIRGRIDGILLYTA